jgi:preprotein translocase subunit SecG
MGFVSDGGGIIDSVKIFFGWIYEPYTALEKVATLTGILSFIIFVVAIVLSFINLPQTSTPARPNTEGEAA